MEITFENVDLWFDGDNLIIACKDRDVKTEERWVIASLSIQETQKLCEFIQNHTTKKEL